MALTSFCCFKDITRATVFIGAFTLLTSLFQIALIVSIYTGYLPPPTIFTPDPILAGYNHVAYILYIMLACMDFIMVLFSIVLLCGNERTDEAKIRSYFLPWLIYVPLYMIFELSTNIYYFTQLYNNGFYYPLSVLINGYAIVPIVYWIFKHILLLVFYVVIYKRAQEYLPCCHCMPYYKENQAVFEAGDLYIIDDEPRVFCDTAYPPKNISLYPSTPIRSCNCAKANRPCGCNKTSASVNVGSGVYQGGIAVPQINATRATPGACGNCIGGGPTIAPVYNKPVVTSFWQTIGRGFRGGFWN